MQWNKRCSRSAYDKKSQAAVVCSNLRAQNTFMVIFSNGSSKQISRMTDLIVILENHKIRVFPKILRDEKHFQTC